MPQEIPVLPDHRAPLVREAVMDDLVLMVARDLPVPREVWEQPDLPDRQVRRVSRVIVDQTAAVV